MIFQNFIKKKKSNKCIFFSGSLDIPIVLFTNLDDFFFCILFNCLNLQVEIYIAIRLYCIFVHAVFQKEELGRLLINIFAVVPGGVVCFFSSYDYEQQVYKHWQTSGLLDKMNARKKVSFCPDLFKCFFACVAF